MPLCDSALMVPHQDGLDVRFPDGDWYGGTPMSAYPRKYGGFVSVVNTALSLAADR